MHKNINKNIIKEVSSETNYRYIFMVLASNKNGLTQSEICDLVHLKKSSVSELLQQMENEELIVRVKDEADNRKSIVKLTCKGKSLDKKIKEAFKKYELVMSDCLSTTEKENLKSYILRMKQALQGGIEND